MFDMLQVTYYTEQYKVRVIVLISPSPLETRSFDVEASLSHDLPNFNFLNLRIKGSCSLTSYRHIYLWNPSTWIHKFDDANDFFGFGYDQSTDDYLVVSIHWATDNSSYLKFFSLRDNTWKTIEGTPSSCKHHVAGLLYSLVGLS